MHPSQSYNFLKRHMVVGIVVFITILGLAWIQGGQGDPKLDEADTIAITKASFLFQFAKSNDWPQATKVGTFKIGIHGNRALYNYLVAKYSSQSIGSQMLEMVWYDEEEVGEFVHILYTESEGELLAEIISSTENKPIMVVTSVSEEVQMPDGAVMNFVIQANRIRYELDMENALSRGLIVGNRILSWAVRK
ncbi:MAG TPA: YfiR family protein [Flavobacteriales bacterium]|nr:YfiR family protein [Flavobacteriales bacterium]